MKIIKLRFKNLNSLFGEWEIDFTDPEYINNGIFAITGPTGAGKSTIMDAICLAIYGRTPRLPKINSSQNEIMSRKTADCFAEVTFSSQAGKFCCSWSQHRARKKVDGKLSSPRHELVEIATGKVLESSLTGVLKAVPIYTGMDFDRFTRSMLLAQGGFAAFLQAGANERAPILEEITGTEIYSRISIKVQYRQAQEKSKLENLTRECQDIAILTDEEKALIEQQIKDSHLQESVLLEKENKHRQALQWYEKIAELQQKISQTREQLGAAEEKLEEFRPQQARLELARRANELEGLFTSLNELRKYQKEEMIRLTQDQEKQQQQQTDLEKQKLRLEQAVISAEKLRAEAKDLKPLLKQTRALDLQIAELLKQKTEAEKEIANTDKKLQQNHEKLQKLAEKIKIIEEEAQSATAYLEKNSQDQALAGQLPALADQLNSLAPALEKLNKSQARVKKAAKEEKAIEKQSGTIALALAETEKKYQSALTAIEKENDKLATLLDGKLLREYKGELAALVDRMILVNKIHELESERKKLQDGVPCILCGATDHPYARGNVPELDNDEKRKKELDQLLNKCSKLEEAISKLKEESAAILAEKSELEKQLSAQQQKEIAAAETRRSLAEEAEILNAELEKSKAGLLNRLEPFGILSLPETDFTEVLQPLSERLNLWQEKQKRREECATQAQTLVSESKALSEINRELDENLKQKAENCSALAATLKGLQQQRFEIFADKSPDLEEKNSENRLEDGESKEKEEKRRYDEQTQKLTETNALIKSLFSSTEARKPEIEKAENDFNKNLQQSGFADETAFISARLSQSEREALQKMSQQLEADLASLKARDTENHSALQALSAQQVSNSPAEEHRLLLLEIGQSLKETRQQIGAMQQRIVDNEQALQKISEKRGLIEAQQREFARWDSLYRLIGSSDGRRYQKFAQGLTFEMLIRHANQQLGKLTDRYLLVHDRDQSLELDVIDNYQAGEIRSSKNLSGGESFIVSLALALGLSTMASQKLRVDSLFLDEGFGTLDEEALDTALTTLSSLHREGKMIGIISHVAALKDRISAQIQVTPDSFGHSRISGPGVSRG